MVLKNKVEKVICNMCGNEIIKNEYGHFEDYLSVNKIWGYNSNFDGLEHSFDICQNCYNDLIERMKIKP